MNKRDYQRETQAAKSQPDTSKDSQAKKKEIFFIRGKVIDIEYYLSGKKRRVAKLTVKEEYNGQIHIIRDYHADRHQWQETKGQAHYIPVVINLDLSKNQKPYYWLSCPEYPVVMPYL